MAAAAAAAGAKIGVLGSKDVGRRLAAGFANDGQTVWLGTRDTKDADLVKWQGADGKKVALASNEDAVKNADVVVLATKWQGTENAIKVAGGAAAFAGKVVIDATNPLEMDDKNRLVLAVNGNNSGGETVQKWLDKAHVVKAFNTLNNAQFVNHPGWNGTKSDLFICGNDAASKATVTKLSGTIGWAPEHVVDMGDITSSRYTEAMCVMWCRYAFSTKDWNSGFALLRSKPAAAK